MENSETLWIEQLRDFGDSEALAKLIMKYRPMIDNTIRQYFVSSYDRDDWYQEARIVCHDSCIKFDGSQGSKFGSFFKMKFKHRVIDLVRYSNSAKRKINGMTESLDDIDESHMIMQSPKDSIEYCDHIQQVMLGMTLKELTALQYTLGKFSIEEACDLAKVDRRSLLIITYRCKKMIKKKSDNLVYE